MNIILGLIIGITLGIICAFGATLYGLTNSNLVGEEYEDAFHCLPDNEPAIFHIKNDTTKRSHSR